MKKVFLGLFLIISCISLAEKRPNILWLTLEDSSPQFFGCYGNSSAVTPAIDSLAAKGVRFSNAYSTATVCSPSRSCIITGVRNAATGNGHHRSTYPLPSKVKGFPSYLKNDGYYTTNNYKTDYNTSDASRLVSESWNASSASAHWRNKGTDQPFFSVFNFNDSHQSRTMTEPYAWYIDNVYDKMTEGYKVSKEDVFVPPFYRDSWEMRKHMARMQNSINYTDKQVGDRLAQLEADGLMDETIIFLYADHGEGMPRGKGNGIGQGYKVPFIVYFPEQYAHLNPWGDEKVVDEVISFEDLAPTLLSLAGVSIPDYYRGRAFLGAERASDDPYVYGSRDRLDDGLDFSRAVMKDSFIYARVFMSDRPEFEMVKYFDVGEVSNAIRNDYWDGKLNENQSLLMDQRPIEYLFDLKNDPWELNNLADDIYYSSIKVELSTQLKAEMRDVRDVHLIPEYQLSQLASPYDDRMDDNILPIDTVLNVAWLSGGGDSVVNQQAVALSSTIDLVRYWAIVGLRIQDSLALVPHQNLIEDAMSDSYLPVQLEAAYIAYLNFDNASAKIKLESFAKGNDFALANAAVQNIVNLNEGGMAFVETLEQVASNGQYHAKILAQTYLHYYNKRELYWGNGTPEVWEPYSIYPFNTDTKDALSNNDLTGSPDMIVEDEVRGKVLQSKIQNHVMTFDNNFFLPKNYTMTFWVRSGESVQDQEVCALLDEDASCAVRVVTNDQSEICLEVNDLLITSGVVASAHKWQNVQLSHWGDEYSLFVDGFLQLVMSDADSSDIVQGRVMTTFDGRIDDLSIYHYPFTEGRAYSVFSDELITDESGLRDNPMYWYKFNDDLTDEMGHLNLRPGSTTAYIDDAERGKVLALDGTASNAVVEDNFPLTDNFSFTLMLQSDNTTKWASPIGFGDATDFVYLCPYTSWEAGLYLVVDNDESRNFNLAGAGAFPVGDWQHIAVTYAVGNWKIYIDGVNTCDVVQEINNENISRLIISGVPHKTGSYFTGKIDELKVYDYPLTASEVLVDKKLADDVVNRLSDQHSAIDISIYPNPADDYLFIVGESAISAINIIDMFGRLVLNENCDSDIKKISLEDIQSGVYIVSLSHKRGTYTEIIRIK